MFLAKKLRCGVMLAPACWLLLSCSTTQAASFGPELTFEARYDDNVLKRPNSLDDFVTVLVPRLRATEVEGVLPWELRLRRTLVSYSRDPALVALSDLAMLRGAYYMAASESVSVGYRYTRSSEPVEVDEDAVVTGGDVFANSGNVGIYSWRAEGSVRARSWAYQRAGLSDGHAQGWDLRYYPVRTRDTGWYFDYDGQNLDLDERGITAHVVTTGLRRAHASWISTEAEIGGATVHFDDGADDQNKVAGAIGLVVERGEQASPIRARFRLAHDVTTTSIAELQRSWEVARVTARWESSLDAEGGIYHSPTLSRRVSLSLLASPDDVRRIALDASYRRVRQYRGESVDANILRLSAAYSTALNSWLRGRASYDYVRQDVPPGGRALEFNRNRVILSLTAALPR
jgi:hypothetical protein